MRVVGEGKEMGEYPVGCVALIVKQVMSLDTGVQSEWGILYTV